MTKISDSGVADSGIAGSGAAALEGGLIPAGALPLGSEAPAAKGSRQDRPAVAISTARAARRGKAVQANSDQGLARNTSQK